MHNKHSLLRSLRSLSSYSIHPVLSEPKHFSADVFKYFWCIFRIFSVFKLFVNKKVGILLYCYRPVQSPLQQIVRTPNLQISFYPLVNEFFRLPHIFCSRFIWHFRSFRVINFLKNAWNLIKNFSLIVKNMYRLTSTIQFVGKVIIAHGIMIKNIKTDGAMVVFYQITMVTFLLNRLYTDIYFC